MARGRKGKGRRLALERLGIQPRVRLHRALVPAITWPDAIVGAVFLLGVVLLCQYELVAALLMARGAVLAEVGGVSGALLTLLGTVLVVGGLGAVAGLVLLRMRRVEPGSWRRLVVFAACALTCVGAARGLVALDAAVGPRWRSLVYFTPLSGFAIFLTVVYGQRRAIAAALLMALLVGLVVQTRRVATAEALPAVVVLLCGALVAILGSARIRHRTTLLAVGCAVGLANALALLGFELVAGRLGDGGGLPPELLWSFLNGLGVGVLLTVLLPFVEMAFNVTTDIRLLELSDQEQPLLRSLVTLAPSTDHHSRRVALLAEAAAESIGANPLLARVGAYYHDVGKMLKPHYFIENLADGESPHDNLRPTMSSLIITTHTKDGVDLAEEYRLPQPIIDVIAQHHGNSVVEFFYNRYLEEASDKERLPESFFRYAGPKPQSREAAIVLLADAVEAACRTLEAPAPARIRALIQRIADNKLRDGQLDQCQLSLRHLHTIQQSFFRVLCAMHHPRITYPDTELDHAGRRR